MSDDEERKNHFASDKFLSLKARERRALFFLFLSRSLSLFSLFSRT